MTPWGYGCPEHRGPIEAFSGRPGACRVLITADGLYKRQYCNEPLVPLFVGEQPCRVAPCEKHSDNKDALLVTHHLCVLCLMDESAKQAVQDHAALLREALTLLTDVEPWSLGNGNWGALWRMAVRRLREAADRSEG